VADDRPRKQEQWPASEDVTEVAPGVLRAQLPIEIPGLRHVNTYILEDERGLAVVDPGMPGKEPHQVLDKRLRSVGLRMKDIHTVVVTHSHPDHFGGAGLLQKQGADLLTHASFSTWFDPEPDVELEDADHSADAAPAAPPLRRRDRTTPWGGEAPRPPLRMRLKYRMARRWFQAPRPTIRVEDAETVRLARREWIAVHTPGHTSDHLCLFDPTDGTLLSGDHVLPTITPHIGGLQVNEDPLAQFFDSLERMHHLDGARIVLPAHGQPFDDLDGRVEAIRQHHIDRLKVLEEAGAVRGPATVSEFSEDLFAPRSWGPMADSETYAHLEHLRLAGRAERVERDGEVRYHVHA